MNVTLNLLPGNLAKALFKNKNYSADKSKESDVVYTAKEAEEQLKITISGPVKEFLVFGYVDVYVMGKFSNRSFIYKTTDDVFYVFVDDNLNNKRLRVHLN
jgi:hypothetical protein